MDFKKELINWYSINKRDLPWRNTKNPYFIWLSEIILQQTQVKQGLPYYEAFIKQYPTIAMLANAPEDEVLKLWQGLGYYSRARNLHYTAKYITEELKGHFPDNYNTLITLKGVGDYTASAIASICFNEPTAVVDGNVYRFLSRLYGIDTPINSTKGQKEFKALASSLIDKQRPAVFNQAIMEFGARQCKPKSPDCTACPFIDSCIAYNERRIDQLPIKLKKTKVTKKHFNFIVCIDPEKNILFEQRTSKGIWQNLYQFPLIESEKSIGASEFHLLRTDETLLKGVSYEYYLYNEQDRIHKLSHQHLHTKFWILEVKEQLKNSIPISEIKSYPTSILISNFIEEFKF